jgi:hypothetical protein
MVGSRDRLKTSKLLGNARAEEKSKRIESNFDLARLRSLHFVDEALPRTMDC